MICNLIIDGNFLLIKNVFALHKSNSIHGDLWNSMKYNLDNLKMLGNFNDIFFVSDSNKSWRKSIYPEYKANRIKNNDIDWDFVFETYKVLKQQLKDDTNIKVLEYNSVEGDDWISIVTKKNNNKNISNLIISADKDLLQLLKYDVNKLFINLQLSDVNNYSLGYNVYLPQNYEIYMDKLYSFYESNSDEDSDLFFDLEQLDNWHTKLSNIIKNNRINSINPTEVLFKKIVYGDKSDNIKSIYEQKTKTGFRGIGEATADKMWKYFESYYDSNINVNDETFCSIIISILEVIKKINLTDDELLYVTANIKRNIALVEMNHKHIPVNLLSNISEQLKPIFS